MLELHVGGLPEGVFDSSGHEVYSSPANAPEHVVQLDLPPGVYSIVNGEGSCPAGTEVTVAAGRTTNVVFLPVSGSMAQSRCYPNP